MPFDDTPKRWVDDEELENNTYDNTSALTPVEEVETLPSIEERTKIIAKSDISDEHKNMLNALMEINKVAEVLSQVQSIESKEARKAVIDIYTENFVANRLSNNLTAENLKNKLLERLLVNVDNLDLETSSNLLIQLHEVMGSDYLQAMARVNGDTAPIPGQGGGINLTINTAEGAQQVTNQTLNNGTIVQGANKETVTLGSTLKQMQTLQMPKKREPIDITYNQGQ